MHPAFSVIAFTVMSGAGYGLFVLLALASLFGFADVDGGVVLLGGATSLILITLGLISSTMHLANPKNAWRAFFRFKTSWLSREGVFAVAFYPFAFVFLFNVYLTNGMGHNQYNSVVGLIAVILALATVFSTGMIYACLKTIRQWNTALTPANYLLLGLASGGVLFFATLVAFDKDVSQTGVIVISLLTLGAITKTIYYFWMGKATGPTMQTATGFTRAQVRLLDTGHTAGTFLTEEFGYQADKGLISSLKFLVLICGFGLPILFVNSLMAGNAGMGVVILSIASTLAGMAFERWLFFAEARHVVNLYHGAQHT
ncbi:MAG: dimethyl sulfoxide reductase anchor subunit family protein [bacterium]